jgi:peptide/nickel transport system ATP-binding protein
MVTTPAAGNLLRIEDLHVTLEGRRGAVHALRGLDLSVDDGETLGLVGESGCGKSMTARAIMNILPPPLRLSGGRILLRPRGGGPALDLAAFDTDSEAMRAVRGGDIAMIFQEPMTALSPVHTIGEQIAEMPRLHQRLDRKQARARTIEMLEIVGMPNARQRYSAYPFNLSGGMRQRAMIAMALSCRPRLLIADEPTTALDVTIQAQILDLLQQLQADFGMSVLLITHDLGVVARTAQRVAVMYLGQIVEEAPTVQLFAGPQHPYTRGLLASIPRLGRSARTRLQPIRGNVPPALAVVQGCAFHPRCPVAVPGLCDRVSPVLAEIAPQHKSRCLLLPAVAAASGAPPQAARQDAPASARDVV